MSEPTEQERLLAEVLAEQAPKDFDASVLAITLRAVRTQKRNRHLARVAACLSALALAAMLVVRLQKPPAKDLVALSMEKVKPASVELISTHALPPSMLVNSEAASFAIVEPLPRGQLFLEISDDELLRLAGNGSVMLIREFDGREELVRLDSNERSVQ